MFINVQLHGIFKEKMPNGYKRKQVVYAQSVSEIVSYFRQFEAVAEFMQIGTFEIRVGPTLKNSRSLTAEEAVKLCFPNGATLHFAPFVNGHGITAAMLINAAISIAASFAVSAIMSLFMPTPDTNKDDRKSVLYQGGFNTQKEGIPLNYLAGLDVLAGSNIIEAFVEYATTGGLNSRQVFFPDDAGTWGLDTVAAKAAGYEEVSEKVLSSFKGGGKMLANSIYTDAVLRALAAISDGPIGGIIGTTAEEKERNIYINQQPLRDHGTNQLTYNGCVWEERIGEEGQSATKITPGVANNIDANVDLPHQTSGGSDFWHTVTVTDDAVSRVRARVLVKSLVRTSKKGNQKNEEITLAYAAKRVTDSTWTSAGTKTFTGKSSDQFVLEYVIVAPPRKPSGETWQFRVHRVTEDADNDRIQNETAFNGHIEFQDIELTYDGTGYTKDGETYEASHVPTATFGLAIDLSQFDHGGNMPEVALRCAGRKVRVPTNYNPVTRAYTGFWDGSWKTAATQNPVWHWYHIATDKYQGLGYPDDFFNKFSLYETAQYCDQNVNGRPRYTLNKQFTDEQDGWPQLVELATSFRAFPYYNGSQIVLVQDRPQLAPDRYVNNTMIEGGYFEYAATPISEQLNEVQVTWDDPSDYFRKKTERYRDSESITRNRALGMANNGIIRETFYKIGCTNRQEAYDFARMLCYVSQHENEIVRFNTMLGAANYVPGQIIAVDDVLHSGKQEIGRVRAITGGKVQLDRPFEQKAFTGYTIWFETNGGVEFRSLVVKDATVSTDIADCDATGIIPELPFGIVESGPAAVQPRWYRIQDIKDIGGGKYSVEAKLYISGKHAWVEEDVPVPYQPFTHYDLKKNIPAPTDLKVVRNFEMDDLKGSIHSLSFSWKRNYDPALQIQNYVAEMYGPDGMWKTIYEGNQNSVIISPALPGKYVFTVKGVNTFNKSGNVASITYEFEYGDGEYPLLPPIFIGFR